MARPLKPFIRGGGYYPSRRWTPLVYPGGYTTANGGGQPEPEPVLKTVTGSLIHITDALALPAEALTVNVEPIQDLHGYDSPWSAGGGKNLLKPKTIDELKTINTYGTWSGNEYSYHGIKFKVNGDGTYDVSGTSDGTQVDFYIVGDINNAEDLLASTGSYKINGAVSSSAHIRVIGFGVSSFNVMSGDGSIEATSTSGKIILRVTSTASGLSGTFKPMIRLSTVSDGTFAPYSNICPISGRTSATIYHSGADTSDPTTYTIQFGDTVYGGTPDVVNGTLTVTYGQIASYAGETLPGAWISDRDVYAVGATPTAGAQVVYELATPIEITLTPTQIEMLLGENNLLADAGDLTLTYYAEGEASASLESG